MAFFIPKDNPALPGEIKSFATAGPPYKFRSVFIQWLLHNRQVPPGSIAEYDPSSGKTDASPAAVA